MCVKSRQDKDRADHMHSQIESRMHRGWTASFPVPLWEGGSSPPGRWLPQQRPVLLVLPHLRLFVTQACSLKPWHSSRVPSMCPGKETLLRWSHSLVPGTKAERDEQRTMISGISAMGNPISFLQTEEVKPERTFPCHTAYQAAARARASYSTGLCCWLFSFPTAWLQ